MLYGYNITIVDSDMVGIRLYDDHSRILQIFKYILELCNGYSAVKLNTLIFTRKYLMN